MKKPQKPTEEEVLDGIRSWTPGVMKEFLERNAAGLKWDAPGEVFDAPVGYDLEAFLALVRQVQHERKGK